MPPTAAELTRLHNAHAVAVHRFAWSVTRDESLAQEVVQELFLKLARDASALAQARSEKAFILTMARNLALDLLRRRQSRDSLHERWALELPEWFEPADDPETQERQQRLATALAALPEDQRSAIHLHVWEELTFREIGELQQAPVQTIASRYRYGLARLRAALETQASTTR